MTIADVGSYSLTFAALSALVAIFSAICARRYDSAGMLRLSRWALHAVTALLTLASVTLLRAFLNDDFRLDYVVRYSEKALPFGYKLAAFWAGQGGSLLLWAWLIAAMGSLAMLARRKDPAATQAPAIAILAAVGGFFTVLMLFSVGGNDVPVNPFHLAEAVVTDGNGLNPMLQDPAMIAHPPLLFIGYAGFTIPMALYLGALIGGHVDKRLIVPIRRWMLVSWVFLTAGIVLGAEWAYVELGWGGYWAWDPVENASLFPWFTATALIHSLIVEQRRGMLKVWNAALVPLTFILCLVGTYLTRSGAIESVHAFGESDIGWYFLGLVGVSLAGALTVILVQRRLLKDDRPLDKPVSFEGAVWLACALLTVMMLTTLVGTIWPIITRVVKDHPATLDAHFYNKAILPMAMGLLILMGMGPLLQGPGGWARRKRMLVAVVLTHVAVIIAARHTGLLSWTTISAATATFILASLGTDFLRTIWVRLKKPDGDPVGAVLQALRANARRYCGQAAHLGMAMLLVGIAGSSLHKTEERLQLGVGESGDIGPYRLTMRSVEQVHKTEYIPEEDRDALLFIAEEARVALTEPDGRSVVLRPQLRQYAKFTNMINNEVAIRSSLRDDVYLAFAGRDKRNVVYIDAMIMPLVSWMWIGGIVMTVGGLLAAALLRNRFPQVVESDGPAEESAQGNGTTL